MKCLIIYNPKCGRQNVVKNIDNIVSVLKEKYEIVDKKASFFDGETRDIAKDACGKYDTIVVAGGDGTLHEVICGITTEEKKPKIGLLPTGTINDVSRSLGISKSVKKGLRKILDGKTICHDIFKINNEYGIYASALGLLTDISYKVNSAPKRKFGKLAYYFSIPKFMFGHNSIDVEYETNGEKKEERVSLVVVLNSRSLAGRKVDKKNNLQDGKFKVVIFKCKKEKIKFGDIFKIIMFFGFGMKKNSKKYEIIETNEFKLKTKHGEKLNVDGECIDGENYVFEMISPGVEIFC